jgi:UDP-N-acetyl-D-galactosamine dehydrogenase
MGITFKENCPDLRNSKVIDVIKELKEFGIDVDIYDPQANTDEVMHEYNITLLNNLQNNNYNALIHAVAHKEFNDINIKDLLLDNGVVYDVKSVLPKELVDGRL